MHVWWCSIFLIRVHPKGSHDQFQNLAGTPVGFLCHQLQDVELLEAFLEAGADTSATIVQQDWRLDHPILGVSLLHFLANAGTHTHRQPTPCCEQNQPHFLHLQVMMMSFLLSR